MPSCSGFYSLFQADGAHGWRNIAITFTIRVLSEIAWLRQASLQLTSFQHKVLFVLRTILLLLSMSAICSGQSATTVKLYPTNPKPLKVTAHLTSKEQRVGKWVYQVFYFRNAPQQEAFRIEIGSYEKGQLVKDWSYGIVVEKDMTSDGTPDYVWYGGDDTGQRLLWFLSGEPLRLH